MTIPMGTTISFRKRLLPPYNLLIDNFADRPVPRRWRYDRIIGKFPDEQCQLSPDDDSKASVRFRPLMPVLAESIRPQPPDGGGVYAVADSGNLMRGAISLAISSSEWNQGEGSS